MSCLIKSFKFVANRQRLLYYFVAFNIIICIYYGTTLTVGKSGKKSSLNSSHHLNGSNNTDKHFGKHIQDRKTSINSFFQKTTITMQNNTAVWWTTKTRGKYSVISNYIKRAQTPNYETTVTLVTHGTYEFLKHSKSQCSQWDGPLSISVYCPGDDFQLTLRVIYFLRQCVACIANKVSWHLVFDQKYRPMLLNAVRAPQNYAKQFAFNCNADSVEKIIAKYAKNFRQKRRLPYPINVLRNVARVAATTRYVFVTDIELNPSLNIVSSFMNLLDREKRGLVPEIPKNQPHVYVLPIFEVKYGVSPPLVKSKLRELFNSKKAIFFHKIICDACQRFPDRLKWLNTISRNNSLNVFRVTKRDKKSKSWEPLYIGTNDEPLYDENLTWEGKQDKMSQMYEMCLLGYNLIILDNAFLVHAPGIKRNIWLDNKRRVPFMIRNRIVHRKKAKSLKLKYKSNSC